MGFLFIWKFQRKNEYLIGDCFLGSTHCGRQAHLWHRHRAWQMRARRGPAPVTVSPASYRTIDLGGKVKKMSENPGMGGFKTGKINNLSYQSEVRDLIRVRGCPSRDILSLRAL